MSRGNYLFKINEIKIKVQRLFSNYENSDDEASDSEKAT